MIGILCEANRQCPDWVQESKEHSETVTRLQFAFAIPIFNPDAGTVPSLDTPWQRILQQHLDGDGLT
eukprot:COSAG02_NODE_437_length_22340_cov_46.269952_4_plen_67_part_00